MNFSLLGRGIVRTTLGLVLLLGAPSFVFAAAPSITLGASTASRGDTVSISGSGFHSGDTITVTITGHTGNIVSSVITVSGNSFSGSTTIPSDATVGNDTVTASDSSSHSATASLTVKGTQTITVGTAAPSSSTYNSSFSVAATASSGLTVTVTTSGGCSNSGNTVTMTSGTTTCVVHYNQAGNSTYSAAPEVTESVTATPKSITPSITASNKIYDGTTSATSSCTIPTGIVGTDVVACSAGATSFTDKNVGTGKTVNASSITLSGASAANYSLSATTANTTATITTCAITVTAAANSKIYDGVTTATGTPTVTSGAIQTGDTANFIETYDTASADTGKTITPSGSVSDGNNGNNYAVTFAAASTGSITPKSLTISGVAAADQVYDGGTTVHSITSNGSLSGVVGTDDVSINAAGGTYSMADKNVGSGKTVTISGIALAGTNAGDYSLSAQPSATVNVTQRSLTVSATGVNKAYDGNTTATAVLSSDALGGDDVTLSYTAQFADPNVANGIAVHVSNIAISGGVDQNNYTLANITADTTANITTASATVALASSQNLNPTYDGTQKAINFTTTPSGLPLSVTYNGSATAPTNAGTYTVVAAVTDPNYSGSDQETLIIAPAPLTVTANSTSKTYGDTVSFTGSEFTNGTMYGSDSISSVSLSSAGAPATAGVSGSPYSIVPSSAVGSGLSNYTISYSNGSLAVNKASLSVTPDNKTKVKGTTFTAFTGSILGLQNSDNITATYASTGADISAATGTYPITATLNDPDSKAGNYNVTLNTGTLTVTPEIAHLTVITHVSNNGGGTASASSFTATVDEGSNGTLQAAGSETGTELDIIAGTYSVLAASTTNYSGSLTGDCSGTAASNDTLTCTISEVYSPTYIYGGGNAPGFTGVVLGTSTEEGASAEGTVLGTSTDMTGTSSELAAPQISATTTATTSVTCTPLPNHTLGFGRKNDSAVVKLLQAFLNGKVGSTLPITGFFGKATRAAAIVFQEKYMADVLKSMGYNHGTGLVGPATLKAINAMCTQAQ